MLPRDEGCGCRELLSSSGPAEQSWHYQFQSPSLRGLFLEESARVSGDLGLVLPMEMDSEEALLYRRR